MPNVRPVSITPSSRGVSARRASIMSCKLGYASGVIHQVKSHRGKHRYMPCINKQDFKNRYKKYVLGIDTIVDPKIYLNDQGEYVINI